MTTRTFSSPVSAPSGALTGLLNRLPGLQALMESTAVLAAGLVMVVSLSALF